MIVENQVWTWVNSCVIFQNLEIVDKAHTLAVNWVRSFRLGIPGTRTVYIFVTSIFNAHSNVNIASSRNFEPQKNTPIIE